MADQRPLGPVEHRGPPAFVLRGGRTLPKAAEMLAQEMRAQILGNALSPGSPLPNEPELIAQSGLGRATVREAIRLLESQGLIVVRRGVRGGIFVAEPDITDLGHSLAPILTLSQAPLRDLTSYRKMVEPPAAGLAATLADDEAKRSLLDLAEHGTGPGYANEIAFHERVAELAGNLLLRVLVVVPHVLLREQLKGESFEDSTVAETNDAHSAIARAIVDGEPERAAGAMMRHLEAFERRLSRQGRLDRPIVPHEQWLQQTASTLDLFGRS